MVYSTDLFETFSLTLKLLFQMHSPKRILALNHKSLTEPYPIGFCFSFLIHRCVEMYKEGSTKRESHYPLDLLRENLISPQT